MEKKIRGRKTAVKIIIIAIELKPNLAYVLLMTLPVFSATRARPCISLARSRILSARRMCFPPRSSSS